MTVGYFVTRAAREDNAGVLEFYDAFPVVRELYDGVRKWTGLSLDEILGEHLPEDHGTSNSYSAIRSIAAQVAVADVLAQEGVRPDAVLGLSLGITSASCMAGAFDRADMFRMLWERRAIPMPVEGEPAQGVAICRIGPDTDTSTVYGDKVDGVYLGLDFGPAPDGLGSWVLLAGYRSALEALAEHQPSVVIIKQGIAAVHSPLRRPAAEFVRSLLDGVRFRDPQVPLTVCLEPRTLTTGEEVRTAVWENLIRTASIPHGFAELDRHGVKLLIVPGPSMADDMVTFPVPVLRVQRPADVEAAVTKVAELRGAAAEAGI
ncbi:ACP S-malonyltransferase [Actinomadura spongiicola]|uniref:[acyl-carrier-protein] S-malonyltransferase n=1 Tax=Actinomadura spongiicola TaxID=2303421 RepID=A0A372GNA0_9ACTN|nr:ACP S-malonyltransferase [Actinomadura spongiicola]RFS86612.1 ACP S-malonyltransferase [Actinomadura spongiicola]